jgi:deazaflavin-dependent oxidoreductase (nitroreductase family)
MGINLRMSNSFQDFNQALIKDLRANKGKATLAPFTGGHLLILTTKGAKSGETRENPLAYTRDGERLVVIASKGGAPTNPSWFHNLVTHPEVIVEAGGNRFKARAIVPQGDEYERLYSQMADIYPNFYEYRQKTSRQIPVVVLQPVEPK